MEETIPIIDFGAYGLEVKDAVSVSLATITSIATSVKHALQTFGCFYLKDHGLDEALVAEYNDTCRHFFEQPADVKQRYARQGVANFGWMGPDGEGLNPDAPMDLKECFNYCPPNDSATWTSEQKFPQVNQKLFGEFTKLAERLNDVFSIAMGQDIGFLRHCLGGVGKPGNQTTIRPLYYHPIPPGQVIKDGQIRCGAHTDFDVYSVLFQDGVGGLEAEIPGRGFVPISPSSGLAFVNIGDVIQRWTADALTATNHRVVVGGDDQRSRIRQSVAYFIVPDGEFIIKCLDGSDTYPPQSYKDFMARNFAEVLY